MNKFGKNKIPFLFIIKYNLEENLIIPINEIDKSNLLFDFEGFDNITKKINVLKPFLFNKFPVDYNSYKKAFEKVLAHLQNGDSYLLNLTFPTKIETNYNLEEIFYSVSARYKLLLKNKFVCFSPEIFIKIKDNTISSFPMKGTLDASLPNSYEILFNDKKELAEHYTIVDLIRNDLSLVAKQVRVVNFRYFELISSKKGQLWQTSSHIQGILDSNWNEYIGNIIFKLLPAGSVTGAPKTRTCNIIEDVENYERGFYTGIAGLFDGNSLNSFVLIRFIEIDNNQFIFKSGGGITTQSNCNDEYLELINKVYVPII
ncbi:MAG: aminodeoxychorismate synthase component I [Candidatus Kapaibacteriota bacterium]